MVESSLAQLKEGGTGGLSPCEGGGFIAPVVFSDVCAGLGLTCWVLCLTFSSGWRVSGVVGAEKHDGRPCWIDLYFQCLFGFEGELGVCGYLQGNLDQEPLVGLVLDFGGCDHEPRLAFQHVEPTSCLVSPSWSMSI